MNRSSSALPTIIPGLPVNLTEIDRNGVIDVTPRTIVDASSSLYEVTSMRLTTTALAFLCFHGAASLVADERIVSGNVSPFMAGHLALVYDDAGTDTLAGEIDGEVMHVDTLAELTTLDVHG